MPRVLIHVAPTVGALGEVLAWLLSNTMDAGFCVDKPLFDYAPHSQAL